MTSFFRIIKFAFQGIYRNIWLSLVTVAILILALLSINFIITVNYIADVSKDLVKEKIDVSVYLKNDISDQEFEFIKNSFKDLEGVDSMSVVTAQEALDNFKRRHASEKDIISSLDELDENPLGPSLILKSSELENYERIIAFTQNEDYKDLIVNTAFDDYRLAIDNLNSIISNVQSVSYGVLFMFVIVSILIIYNTVRMTIYTHRNEISIMKLVGASNFFIRGPFIIESILLGLFALFFTIILLYPIFTFIQPFFYEFFAGNFNILTFYQDNMIFLFGIQGCVLILINILSSYIAVGRYIDV